LKTLRREDSKGAGIGFDKSINDLTAEEEVELENILLACEDPDDGDAVETEFNDGFDDNESGWFEGDEDDEAA
jgi:hypothetical protein